MAKGIGNILRKLASKPGREGKTSISAEDGEGRKYSLAIPACLGGGTPEEYAVLGGKTAGKVAVKQPHGGGKLSDSQTLTGAETAMLVFVVADTDMEEDAAMALAVACGAVKPDAKPAASDKPDDKPVKPAKKPAKNDRTATLDAALTATGDPAANGNGTPHS